MPEPIAYSALVSPHFLDPVQPFWFASEDGPRRFDTRHLNPFDAYRWIMHNQYPLGRGLMGPAWAGFEPPRPWFEDAHPTTLGGPDVDEDEHAALEDGRHTQGSY